MHKIVWKRGILLHVLLQSGEGKALELSDEVFDG